MLDLFDQTDYPWEKEILNFDNWAHRCFFELHMYDWETYVNR